MTMQNRSNEIQPGDKISFRARGNNFTRRVIEATPDYALVQFAGEPRYQVPNCVITAIVKGEQWQRIAKG